MDDLQTWGYDKSVEWMQPRISKWVDMWDEIEPELIIAKQETLHQGARNDLTSGTNSRGWGQYCEDIGITKRWANKLLAKAHVSQNTGDNEWYTPKEYITSAEWVLRGIDLDPASTSEANEIVKAHVYYTADANGLDQEWHGRVWMNPPYASGLIDKFSQKLIEQLQKGNVTEAIVLVNNATDTKWLQLMLEWCNAICFPQGRIHFWSRTKETASPLQGQAILYFGEGNLRFKDEFKQFGEVFYSSE